MKKGMVCFVLGLMFGGLALGQMGWQGWPGTDPMDRALIFPQVAVGGDYVTHFLLFNPNGQIPLRAALTFYRSDGTEAAVSVDGTTASRFVFAVPAEGSLLKTARGVSPALQSGWALLDVEDTNNYNPPYVRYHMADRIVATAIYEYAPGGKVQSQVAVHGVHSGNFHAARLTIPVHRGSSANVGVALVNAGNTPATLLLTLRDDQGKTVGSQSLELRAGHQIARFVGELFPSLPAEFLGLLTVDHSQHYVVALGMLQSGGIFMSMPVGFMPREAFMMGW
ncbi:MAG: hypothetical protein HY652_08630 [Acidobacteria bacterium]|nr:hypothetical protein [Acidobacteriota bacterium]